jgi:hypothetical protein
LGAGGAATLLALAGCNPFSSAPKTLTVTTEAPPPTAPLLSLVYKTQLHVDHLKAAIAGDKRDAAVLTMLLHDREAHLTALHTEYARSIGKTSVALSTASTAKVTVPSDPDEVLALIRGDAATAQTTFTDQMSGASPYRAELFGSIAACMATHRAVLA